MFLACGTTGTGWTHGGLSAWFLILDHHKCHERTGQREAERSQHDHTKTEDKRFVDRLFQRKPQLFVGTGR